MNLNKQLIEVAKDGNISEVKTLITQGADINAKPNDGYTALMLASLAEYTEIVDPLTVAGATE